MSVESIADRVEETLKQRILCGELAPGSIAVEPDLAKEFGVSKTPVREALQRLAFQGHVTILPKRGYLIRSMGLSDVLELIEVRTLLEPHVAAEASRHPGFYAAMRSELDLQHTLALENAERSMEHGRAFHETLALAGGNSRIAETLKRSLNETARAYHIVPGMRPYLCSSSELAEHEAIFAAVSSGDSEEARHAMLGHLQSIRRAVVSQFA